MSNDIIKKEIETKFKDTISDKTKEFFDYISINTIRLNNNINNILKLEQVNSLNNLEIINEKINLKKLLEEQINNIKPIVEFNNIFLTTKLSNITIESDKEKIKVIIDNILSNSIKFCKDTIEVNVYSKTKNIYISIKNNKDGNNIKNNKGTSYGLKIIEKLAKAIKGEITINDTKESYEVVLMFGEKTLDKNNIS